MHYMKEEEETTKMGKVKYSPEMKELRRKEKELAEEKEKVEILKRSLHIFMQAEE